MAHIIWFISFHFILYMLFFVFILAFMYMMIFQWYPTDDCSVSDWLLVWQFQRVYLGWVKQKQIYSFVYCRRRVLMCFVDDDDDDDHSIMTMSNAVFVWVNFIFLLCAREWIFSVSMFSSTSHIRFYAYRDLQGFFFSFSSCSFLRSTMLEFLRKISNTFYAIQFSWLHIFFVLLNFWIFP